MIIIFHRAYKLIVLMTCAIILMSEISSFAVMVPVGKGAYTTELPQGRQGPSNSANQPVKPKVSSQFNKLPITHKWWSSLIWQFDPQNPWSENLFAYPLGFKASAQGVGLGYTTVPAITPDIRVTDGHVVQEYHYEYAQDLTVSVVGLQAQKTVVDDYSDWAFTALWQGQTTSLRMTTGQGLPFAYFTVQGTPITITPSTTPIVWYNKNGTLGVTVNGHTYGIFGPSGSQWSGTTALESTLNGKDYFSIAALPDATVETLEFYRTHAYAFVTNTSISWNYDEQTGQLQTTYSVETTPQESGSGLVNRPLLGLFKHQWLHTTVPFTSYRYISPRGVMHVIDATEFTTTMKFAGILPALPGVIHEGENGYSEETLFEYIDQIYQQSPEQRWPHTDTYWTGKDLGHIAMLVPIADQLKYTQARDLFLREIKEKLESWFKGDPEHLFYYDTTWKTLIGYPASYGSDTQLNDHHFHYGYFIMAAAIVALYDPTWADAWGGMVNLLISDANNPDRTNKQFPFLRQFNVYAGHNWANGPSLFAAGNNQESSSEALNFASAVILWGTATGNMLMRDAGIYLYTTERTAVENYWFDIDTAVFPAGFTKPTLGILWGNGGAYSTWFGGTVEQLHGINFLPITGGSLYLGYYPDYLRINQNYMKNNSDANDVWKDINASIMAYHDPKAAIETITSPYTPEDGETKAHTYHWVYNISKLGKPETATYALGLATATTFLNGTTRTYVAFNPTPKPLTVVFSDGVMLRNIQPHTTQTETRAITGAIALPQVPLNPQDTSRVFGKQLEAEAQAAQFKHSVQQVSPSTLRITFTPAIPSKFVDIHYTINKGGQLNYRMNQKAHDWTITVPNIQPSNIINYSFTYEKNGPAFNSPLFTFTAAA